MAGRLEKSNNLDISLEFKIDPLIFNFTNLLSL